MHLATQCASWRSRLLVAATLAAASFATAMPTVANLNGDVLAYREKQDQNVTPALIDVGGDAVISMGFTAGVDKFQFQFTGGSTASEDSFYFGNYGTGAGQVIVGWTDDGLGNWGNYAKVNGGVVGTWDGSTNTITFNGTANSNTVMTLVHNLRYSNSAPYSPSTATRTVRLSFTDWTNQTLTVNTSVTVTSVDDAPRFVGAGYAATDVGSAVGEYGYGHAVAQQPDGKYVVVYEIGDPDWNIHVAVARFNADGTIDTTFGIAGWYHSSVINPTTSNNFKGLLIRTDAGQAGKIVVSTTDNETILLLQLTSNGTLDSTFGNNGLCRFDAGAAGSLEEVCAIAQQADGKIVAAGSFYDGTASQRSITLWRFKADGSGLDATFASPLGYARATIANSYSYGFSLLVQPDGKIVLGGLVHGANNTTDPWDIGIRRYNTDGTLDTTFGTAGMAQLDYADTYEGTVRIGLQTKGPNAGKVIVVGNYALNSGTTSDLIVARLNPDGTPDSTFGTAGWTAFDIANNKADIPAGVAIDADDNIVVATGSLGFYAATVRLTANGALDPTFNGTGKLDLSSFGNNPLFNGVIVDASGKIVLVGAVEDFENNPVIGYTNEFGILARIHPDGTFDAMGSAPFVPGGSAVAIDPDIQVFDGELAAANYAGARLTIARHGGANATDLYGTNGTLSFTGANFVVGGTTIGTFTNTGGTLTVTFNSSATTALLRTAFRQITYRNSSATPPPAVQLDWLFSDGNTAGAQGAGGAQTALGVTVVDIAIPRIYSISPAAGPLAGGTAVTLNGRYFTSGATVRFGSTPATSVTFNSSTSLTAVAPAGTAGTVHVGVITANGSSPQGTSDQFTYVGVPTVTGITPASGSTAGGTSVTITGANLAGATAVRFGTTTAASYTVNSATSITATSPAGAAGTVDLTVTTAGGTSATVVADRFTYIIASYADWARSGFSAADLANSTISGPTADPDGTGVTNLMRYALDLPARGPVAATTTAAYDGSAVPPTISLGFAIRATADDLLYEVQSSTDLVTWTTIAPYSANGTKRTEFASADVPAGAKRFFLRLRVTQVP